jgi:hypothetical protein
MQERPAEAEKNGSAWYLARGEKQYGPLADRELLLLAERGGLRTDDLLWKPGFDSWKSLHALKDLVASPSSVPASPQRDETKSGVVEPAEEAPRAKRSLRERLYDELRKFLVIFAYLWLVFFVFLAHEWTVLASHHIGFKFYGLAAINALILSKIMLIAEGMRFAEGLKHKPLVYPIALKSISFTVLLMTAYILEEIGVGMFHGKSMAESFPQIGGGGVAGALTIGIIMCIALVPFFSFKEIARALGEAEFRSLMLGPGRERQPSRMPAVAPAE